MEHQIPLETHVSFKDVYDGVYIVSDYQTVLGPCPKDCKFDHDCYEEAYICVRREIRTAFPLSKLQYIFDPKTHVGRAPTQDELTVVEE